ncbi:MAG: single-stranded DNA-binding protein [Verrucomicrobia bacterium]|nr:single-stranded DNA-binding protein [Verrucomicrobiota bacterium]MCH8510130.1 single-stranded DNA-binding protein [Kiritimatiellia bacterium]
MASYNRIILCGNLTADPELAYAPSGIAICKMRLAVNERVKSQSGEWTERTCFVDVTAFGNQAEPCNQYLSKGSPILLEGKLRYETWDAPDGSKRSKHSVVADRVQFLSTRSEDEQGGGGAPAPRPSAPAASAPRPQATKPSPPPPPAQTEDDENLPF